MTFFLLYNKHNTTLYARDVSKATAFLNRLVHLMKKTVAPEALWLCSAALCFLDGEKILFFTSDVLQVASLSRNSMVQYK